MLVNNQENKMQRSRFNNAALAAILLSSAFGAPAIPAPDRRLGTSITESARRRLDPRRFPVPSEPFSSDRQHARAARLYMATMPNGHTVMQQRMAA